MLFVDQLCCWDRALTLPSPGVPGEGECKSGRVEVGGYVGYEFHAGHEVGLFCGVLGAVDPDDFGGDHASAVGEGAMAVSLIHRYLELL